MALGGPRSGEIQPLNGSAAWPPLDPIGAKRRNLKGLAGDAEWLKRQRFQISAATAVPILHGAGSRALASLQALPPAMPKPTA